MIGQELSVGCYQLDSVSVSEAMWYICVMMQGYQVDPARAERARWDVQSRETIQQIAKRCPQCKSPTEKNGW